MIRIGEIESDLMSGLDGPILMKLGAIVGDDGFERRWFAPDESFGFLVEGLGGSILEFADHEEACFSLHQGHDAVGRAFAQDRIDLPVPAVPTAFHAFGAFGNMTFSGHAAPAVIGSVALSPQLWRLPEVSP